MGTDAGYSGLEQEDVSERRRTEDEEETLRMTQKVSNKYNSENNNQMAWCESPTVSRRDWTGRRSALVLVFMKAEVMRIR